MPINNINGYNDAFKAFTDFATQAKSGSTIAQVGGTGPLAGRTIVAKTSFDFIGNVGRRQESRDVNNAVRDLFKQAIEDMFGGVDKIPASVKDAMKLEDFGKGKPLTARRILAVKTAVDQVAAKTSNCIAESKAHFEYTKEGKEEGDKRIDTAFASCNGNADAMDIVKANIRPLTVNTQSSLRPEADVQKKVGRLLDNLNELKEVSKNNPAIYAAGKKMLEESGVSLPKGMIAKLVQTANDAPLKAFGKLSGGSSVMDIHKAVMQMHKTIKTAMISSGAEKLDGADEKMGARDFVAAALLSRCGKGGLANIRKALDSQNASALNEYYSFSDAGRNGLVENPSDDLKEGIKVVGRIGLTYLEKLDNAVNDNLRELNPGAHEESRVKKFEGEFDIDDFGGDELVDDTVSIANDINDELVQNFVDATVQGSGKGSEAIKNVIRTKLDGSNDPGEKLGKRLSANANAMMNWSIGGEKKKAPRRWRRIKPVQEGHRPQLQRHHERRREDLQALERLRKGARRARAVRDGRPQGDLQRPRRGREQGRGDGCGQGRRAEGRLGQEQGPPADGPDLPGDGEGRRKRSGACHGSAGSRRGVYHYRLQQA